MRLYIKQLSLAFDMSDNDYEEVSLDEFMLRKTLVTDDQIDAKMRAKITTILTTYDCFTKEVQFFAPPSAFHGNQTPFNARHNGGGRGGGNNRYASQHTNHNHNRYRGQSMRYGPQPTPPKIIKTPLKEVHGLLNKITVNSYRDLAQKIIRCCAYKECSQEVIQAIIRKCYTAGSYAHLYHNLLREMSTRYEDQVKEAISTFTSTMLEELTNNTERLKYTPNPMNDYEGYCEYVKNKNTISLKLKTAIRIQRDYDSAATSVAVEAIEIITNKLHELIADPTPTLFDYLDILTSLISMVTKEKAIPPTHISTITEIYNDIRRAYTSLPKKTEFCWQEIVSLLK